MSTIRTFDLKVTTVKEYHLCKDALYQAAEDAILDCCVEIDSNLLFTFWEPIGITILLQRNSFDPTCTNVYFKVNADMFIRASEKIFASYYPRKGAPVIMEAQDYDGHQYAPLRNSKLVRAFSDVLRDLPLNINSEQLELSRIDISEDAGLCSEECLHAFMRCIRKIS